MDCGVSARRCQQSIPSQIRLGRLVRLAPRGNWYFGIDAPPCVLSLPSCINVLPRRLLACGVVAGSEKLYIDVLFLSPACAVRSLIVATLPSSPSTSVPTYATIGPETIPPLILLAIAFTTIKRQDVDRRTVRSKPATANVDLPSTAEKTQVRINPGE